MSWQIEGFIWLEWIEEKIITKHGVQPYEVEEAFFNAPRKIRRMRADKYQLVGRSDSGRYLSVVFVWEERQVKVITARDMTDAERHFYNRK